MKITSIMDRRGRVTIPREIRRSLNLGEGDRIMFVHRDGEVVLQPLAGSLLELRGTVPVAEPQDFTKVREQVVLLRARAVAQGKT